PEPQSACTLLTQKTGRLELKGCPTWLIPNEQSSGYYRWSLDAEALQNLIAKGMPALSTAEKMGLGQAIVNAWAQQKLGTQAAFAAVQPLLEREKHPAVLQHTMKLYRAAHRYLEGDPAQSDVERRIQRDFRRVFARVGLRKRPRETAEQTVLRRDVLELLLYTGKDQALRASVDRMGRRYLGLGTDNEFHPEALDIDIAQTVLGVVGESLTPEDFDALSARLEGEEESVRRGHLLAALTAVRDEALRNRALALVLDERVRVSEAMRPLWGQLADVRTRDGAWAWLSANLDKVMARLSPRRSGWLPAVSNVYCSADKAKAVEALFTPRLDKMAGGKRELSKAVEGLQICQAGKDAHRAELQGFFAR
ncbi:MAG: ERAP1-like C-terminal domain-containing protein, partial [Myxococcota bacterium]